MRRGCFNHCRYPAVCASWRYSRSFSSGPDVE
jgi:hypothetical protein